MIFGILCRPDGTIQFTFGIEENHAQPGKYLDRTFADKRSILIPLKIRFWLVIFFSLFSSAESRLQNSSNNLKPVVNFFIQSSMI